MSIIPDTTIIGKSLVNPPPFIHILLYPFTYETVCFTPELFKIVYFTPRTVFQLQTKLDFSINLKLQKNLY